MIGGGRSGLNLTKRWTNGLLAFTRLKLGFFHVSMSRNNFKHSHFLRFFALRGENSKLNFKNNFYLIKLIFHDPISTKWLKGFQKYFAYILPMVQGCTQTILVSIWKKYFFFKILLYNKNETRRSLGKPLCPPPPMAVPLILRHALVLVPKKPSKSTLF